jgi:hypothetical protein
MMKMNVAIPETAQLHTVPLVLFLQNRIFPPLVIVSIETHKVTQELKLRTLTLVVFRGEGRYFAQ